MDERIYAEDIKACPKCGSTEFWENWIGNDEIESRINRIVAIARLAEKLKKILSDTQIEIRDENQINNFIGCEWEFEHGSEYYA